MSVHVHIMNHTHWDREWFLTSEYTSRWIPGLLKNIEQRAGSNPSYRYLLDGQTLVVEDLLMLAPEMEPAVRALVENQRLTIGPYYSQPDWQLAGGELLLRNLQYGLQDVRRFGGQVETGWLVDTFGHISQTPQIHRLFGLKAVYVWRGVPELLPAFEWQGADGSQILTINLFGGYRNLYGVTHAPEVAVRRLTAEVERLAPYYATPDIPLFDGYDLEDDPEDPLAFYAGAAGLDPKYVLHEATPASYASLMARKSSSLPVLKGEINSGKYGATFPGVFSSRTYLKIMAGDCQELLYRRGEPLASMAYLFGQPYPAQRFERLGRALLQNGVHDCICGVSIDQVHEKMCLSYQDAFDQLQEILSASAACILKSFSPGEYALSTNPFASETWQAIDGHLLHVRTHGMGVWPVSAKVPCQKLPPEPALEDGFEWRNDHYSARLEPNGSVHIGGAVLGELRVYAEKGDTYTDERGELSGVMLPAASPRLIEHSQRHAILEYDCAWRGKDSQVTARVRLTFDPSPLVRWQVELDSRGADLCVEMLFRTAGPGEIWAGMPFDVVRRPEVDRDLLPRQVSPALSSILLGQRELGEVRTFPFHDLVSISNPDSSSTVFARGLHAYRVEESAISLTLRRSVEWLTRANLESRIGDAGPFFYVPDARCERMVSHELAFAVVPFPAHSMEVQAMNAAFQNPALVVRNHAQGSRREWSLLHLDLPTSSLQVQNGELLARVYNPTGANAPLPRAYVETDVWGNAQGEILQVAPKKITTLRIPPDSQAAGHCDETDEAPAEVLNAPQWRVGPAHGLPDTAILDELQDKIKRLEVELAPIKARLAQMQADSQADSRQRYLLEHRQYVLQREQLEYRLSLLLNQRKLQYGGPTPPEILYRADPEIAAIGKELNRLRIQRRIFDYVVQALD